MFLLKDSSGKKSISYTMMIVGFCIISLWLTVSIVAKIGHVDIRQFSGSEAMSYFSPLALLYFGRKWSDSKTISSTEVPEEGDQK